MSANSTSHELFNDLLDDIEHTQDSLKKKKQKENDQHIKWQNNNINIE